MIRVVHETDLPVPTPHNPWSQVKWLFDQRAGLAKSVSAAENFRNAKTHFVQFLEAHSAPYANKAPYWINDEFDEYILLRFKQYVDDLRLSSSHTNTVLSASRQTIKTAIANRWIELSSFIDFSLPSASRETQARVPYTESETAAILAALKKDIGFARQIVRPTRMTHMGHAPETVEDGLGGERVKWGWWRDEANIRWYFENRLNGEPITGTDRDVRHRHRRFLSAAWKYHGGLHNLYRRWGVTAWIGPELILPFACKLIAETGLNPTVALALRVDDYVEQHPLTGRPFIRYWKERGSGEGDLHVDLIDTGVFVLDEQQSRQIKRIWEDVGALTSSLRPWLSPESRDRLFVYQSRGSKTAGQARDFLTNDASVHAWAKEFGARHKLTSDCGTPLRPSLARFRPSLVSRMLKRGVDIHVIKSVMGHKSVLTTLRYIDSHDFAPHARREVQNALNSIRQNRQEQETSPKPLAGGTFASGETVFTTGIALCKNVFNPPTYIRKATGLANDEPCSLFNMCLRCPNVLIMEEHLPNLFALRRQYVIALENGLSGTTHRAAIQQNLHVLNNLLDPETSDWSESVLAEARRRSQLIDSVADPVAIRGVR